MSAATPARDRRLNRSELRLLAVLGVPTFALALAITTVSTYLPVLAQEFTDSSIVIGLLIGGEGLLALWLPLTIGAWSDRLVTPLGGRLPFLIAAAPPLIAALALLGFVSSVLTAALVVAVFFVGYFVAYEPYRALYPDLVSHDVAGRAQSSQAIFRGLGTFLALLGGGLLISIGDPWPFVGAALIVAVSLALFLRIGIRRRRERGPTPTELAAAEKAPTERRVVADLVALVRGDRQLRAFLVANALWELSLAALKTFIVLYVTGTLGFSLAGSSGTIAAAALFVLVGAVISGPLGDRVGRARVMRWSLVVYGAGLLVPFATTATVPLLIAAPLVAGGAGVAMSLPYALLTPLMPDDAHGALTGLYSLSRGVGTSLGPLLAGVAVQAAGNNYQWVWLVCTIAILISIPVMAPLRDD